MERTLPLANKRILITRSHEQASYFSAQVQALGGTPLEVPLLQFQLPANWEKVKTEIEEVVSYYEWIVFTSVNGVNFFFDLHRKPLRNRIACVGVKTNQAIKERGYRSQIMPSRFSAEDLARAFEDNKIPSQSSILLVQGNIARPVLREDLQDLGYNVKQIIVYENKLAIPNPEIIRKIKEEGMDLVTFTSPSTVHNFVQVFGKQDVKVAVIGRITKMAAEDAGFKVAVCPDEYTIEGMLEAILQFFQKEDT